MPKITDISNGQGVLVKVLRVGVDGTDKEINAAEYGNAPEGEKFLITGHENFGQVMEAIESLAATARSSSRSGHDWLAGDPGDAPAGRRGDLLLASLATIL